MSKEIRLTISANNLITNETQVSEQLVVMRLAIGQASLFIMAMTQEGFLALGTHKVLDMPMLAQGGHDPLLDGTTTSATNGDAHAIMAAQAVKLVHVVGRKTSATLDFTSR